MSSVNKVIVVGYAGKDAETRYAPSGSAITNATIATSRSWKDKTTGEKQEETEWHRIVFYDRLAEIAGEYIKKGQLAYVEGRLKTRKWTDKDGVEKYTTEIIADQLRLLGGRGERSDAGGDQRGGHSAAPAPRGAPQTRGAAPSPAPRQAPQRGGHAFDDIDNDIPF
jgi:single-strand DNA-binding protein